MSQDESYQDRQNNELEVLKVSVITTTFCKITLAINFFFFLNTQI
jgi:hypothetical protein